MSGGVASAGAGAGTAPARRAAPSLPAAAVACVVLAVASLAVPVTVDYDPLAWLVWGREVAALDLDTRGGGPAWKPLPVAVNALLAVLTPLEQAPPAAWLVVSRAGGLLALVLAYRIAAGVAGPLAGAVAAAVLASTTGFVAVLLLPGMSEPLLAALVLLAVDRHLAGARTAALLCLWAAGLLRPETWPFLGAYGLVLWVRVPRLRLLLVGLAVLLGLAWFGGEYWGSGDAFRSSQRAGVPTQGGPLLTAVPGLAVLGLTATYLIAVAWPGVLVAAVTAVRARRAGAGAGTSSGHHGGPGGGGDPDGRVTLGVLLLGLGWVAVVAAMTQAGLAAGEQRYLIGGAALLAVVAGVGWSRVLAAAASIGRKPANPGSPGSPGSRGRPRPVGALAVVVLAAVAAVPDVAQRMASQRGHYLLRAEETLALRALRDGVEGVGGAQRVTACGAVTTGRYRVPAVAWTLGVSLPDVGYDPVVPGVLLRYRRDAVGDPVVPPALSPLALPGEEAAQRWELFTSCPG